MDYRWVQLLGQGGFGQVHEVAHRHKPADAPHIALKLIKAPHNPDDEDAAMEALAKTAREMEHHQRVSDSSEFIVSLLTWGQIGDEFFFVSMELCPGGDVAKLLESPDNLGRGLAVDLRWKLYKQIAMGVAAIHEAVRR
jgi:serine/threonine protein kinase